MCDLSHNFFQLFVRLIRNKPYGTIVPNSVAVSWKKMVSEDMQSVRSSYDIFEDRVNSWYCSSTWEDPLPKLSHNTFSTWNNKENTRAEFQHCSPPPFEWQPLHTPCLYAAVSFLCCLVCSLIPGSISNCFLLASGFCTTYTPNRCL